MAIKADILKKVRKHLTAETHPNTRVLFRKIGQGHRQQIAHLTAELWGADDPGDTVLGVVRIFKSSDNGKTIEVDPETHEPVTEELVGYVSWEPIKPE